MTDHPLSEGAAFVVIGGSGGYEWSEWTVAAFEDSAAADAYALALTETLDRWLEKRPGVSGDTSVKDWAKYERWQKRMAADINKTDPLFNGFDTDAAWRVTRAPFFPRQADVIEAANPAEQLNMGQKPSPTALASEAGR